MSKTRQLLLVAGPARSGKSEWAETLAKNSGKQVFYIATALAYNNDAEWQGRIAQHQRRRPSSWQTLEVPVDLAEAIAQLPSDSCCLVDSLGTWLANLLDQDENTWNCTQQALLANLLSCAADVIVVAEETGWGIVPAYPAGRLFRDRLGMLARKIGAIATSAYLVTSGYALELTALAARLPDSSSAD